MSKYICLDCEQVFDEPEISENNFVCCPNKNCNSEDIETYKTYLENEAENKKDEEVEDRLLWMKKK